MKTIKKIINPSIEDLKEIDNIAQSQIEKENSIPLIIMDGKNYDIFWIQDHLTEDGLIKSDIDKRIHKPKEISVALLTDKEFENIFKL